MAPPADLPTYLLLDDDARRLSSFRQMLLDAGKHQLMQLAMEPEAELKRKIALIPPNDINARKKLFDEFMGKMQDLARLSEEDVKARFVEEREWSRSISVGLGNANAGPSRQPRSSVDDGMADLYEALGNMPFLNADNEDEDDSDGGSSTEGEEDDRRKQPNQHASRRRSGTVGPPLPDSRAAEQRSKSATVSPRQPARPELIATSFSAASHGAANSNVAGASVKIQQQQQQQQVEPPELSPRRRAQSTSSTRDEFKMFASIAGHHRQPSGGSNASGVNTFTPTSANTSATAGDHNKHTIWVPPKPAHMQTAPNSSSNKSKHSSTSSTASSAAPSRPTSHASQMSAANSTSSNVSNASNASNSSNIAGTSSRSQSQNPQSTTTTKKSGRARSEDPSERKPEKMNISTSTHSNASATGSRQHQKQATDPAPSSSTSSSSSNTPPAPAAPTATVPIATKPKPISRDTSQAPSADHGASSAQTPSLTLSHAHAQVQAQTQNEQTPSVAAQASTPTPAFQARGSHHATPQHTPLPTPSQMPAQGLFWTPSSSAADEKDRERKGVRSTSSSRSSSAVPKHRATVEDVGDDGDDEDGQAIVETMLSGMWMPPDEAKSKSNGHSAASTPATRSHSNSSASSNAFGFGFTPFSATTPATSGISSPPPLPHRSASNHSHMSSYANATSNTHGTAHASFTALGGFDQSTVRAPSAPRVPQPSLEATFGIGRTVSGSSTSSEKSNVSGVSSSSSGSVSSGGFGGFGSWADLGEKEKEREKKDESNSDATSSSHARWVPGPEKEKEKERTARPLRRTGPYSTISSSVSNPSASASAEVEIPATQDKFYAMSDVAKTERLRVRRGELKNRAEVVAHYERKMFALMREFAEALNRVEDP